MDLANLAIRIQTADINRGVSELDRLASAGARAERATDRLTLSTNRVAKATEGFNSTLSKIGRGAALTAGVTVTLTAIAAISKSLYEASSQAERLKMSLSFSFGASAGREISYVTKLAGDLGVNALTATQAYGKLSAAARGTTLAGDGARAIFESISKASVVMGLTTEQTGGAFMALEQMISKGTVSAEELRGQLGERLPGAFQIAARAMSVTTQELGKMLEQGQVVAEDFLPKFAAQLNKEIGDAADNAANRLDGATNRMSNAFLRIKTALGNSGISELMKDIFERGTNDMNAMAEAMERAKNNGKGFLGQLNDAAGMGLGRALGLNKVSDDFKTLDAQIQSNINKITSLNAEIDKQGGKANFQQRAALGLAEKRLNLFTKERQLRDAANELNPNDRRLEQEGKLFQAGQTKKQQAAKKVSDLMAKYADKEEKAENAVKKARKEVTDLGGEFTPELEASIRKSFEKKGPKPKDLAGDEIKQLKEKNALVGQSTELEKVDSMIKIGAYGKITPQQEGELRRLAAINTAKENTLDQQKKEAEEMEHVTEKLQKEEQARITHAERMREENEELRAGIELMGLDEKAAAAIAVGKLTAARARKEETLAMMEANGESGNSVEILKEEIAILKEREGLVKEKNRKGAKIKEDADLLEKATKTEEKLADSISDGIMEGFRDGTKWSEIFIREVQAQWANTVLRPSIQYAVSGGKSGGDSMLASFIKIGASMMGGGAGAGASSVVGGVPWTSGFDLGGLAGGGQAGARSMHEVNEDGPELLSVGGKDVLMMGGQGGTVTPAGAVGGTVVHLTYAPVTHVDSRTDQAQIQSIIAKNNQSQSARLVDKLQRTGKI